MYGLPVDPAHLVSGRYFGAALAGGGLLLASPGLVWPGASYGVLMPLAAYLMRFSWVQPLTRTVGHARPHSG
jgi:hypothetical protein